MQSSQEMKLNNHPQSSAEVMNEWSYTLTPQNTSMPCTMATSPDNLCFPRGIGLLRKWLKWAIRFGLHVAVNKNCLIQIITTAARQQHQYRQDLVSWKFLHQFKTYYVRTDWRTERRTQRIYAISEKIRKRLEICHQADWMFHLPDFNDQGPYPYKTTGESLIYCFY
jgi:hypothetical protein